MRTITKNICTFDELSESAKLSAISNYKETLEINLDFFKEDAIEQIENAGFTNPTLSYSLTYSQGDGLSFTSNNFNKFNELLSKYLNPKTKQKTIQTISENLELNIQPNNNRYCYSTKNDIEIKHNLKISHSNIRNILNNIEQDLQNHYITLCKKLEDQGYKDIEYQGSDEYIIECITENNIEFDEQGNIYNY